MQDGSLGGNRVSRGENDPSEMSAEGTSRSGTGLIGQVLSSRYLLESKLGSGGMSTVYLALDQTLQRKVAAKVLHREMGDQPDQLERFRREARPAPLSGAAHEVLACALYLGPLTRGAVSRVRGVNSEAVIRSLIERNLLVEVGADHDAPGSPALLGVTDEFLAATGASSRKDFPPVNSLVTQEELDRVHERLASSGTDPPDAGSEPS